MRRQDWVVAGALAATVAMAVIAAGVPPAGWAEDAKRITIPSLPPTQLKIPTLDATIKATAERKSGEVVKVSLVCLSSASHAGATVSMTLQVYQMDPRAMMSRSPSRTSTPQQLVAKADCYIQIDGDGQGRTSVDLPLNWTSDDAAKPEKGKTPLGYYMVLSSPLAAAKQVVQVEEVKVQGGQRASR